MKSDTIETNCITGGAIGVLQTGVIHVESCDFIDNEASYGAAIHCYFGGDAYVNNSRFYKNKATGISTNGGGAIAVTLGTGSVLQVENSTFEQNIYFQNDANGRAGAALFVFGGTANLKNCTFNDNQVTLFPKPLKRLQNRWHQRRLVLTKCCRFLMARDLTLHNDLRACGTLRFQQYRVHICVRCNPSRTRLQGLRPANFTTIRRDSSVI